MNDQQVYRQYQKLRKQIFNINELVVQKLEKFQKNMTKKRLNTSFQPQKLQYVREKEIENNFNILQRMKKQFNSLKHKSQTIVPKQSLQNQIQNTRSQINTMKQKIASLKLKNKDIGDNIINTDQVILEMKDFERELQTWMGKKKKLQTKLVKVQAQSKQVQKNLSQLSPIIPSFDKFTKKQEQTKKISQETKKNSLTYQQKKYTYHVLRKNFQVMMGVKQKKYHDLLKQFEAYDQRYDQIQMRINESSLGAIYCADEIKTLESKLRTVKDEKNKFFSNQQSFNDQNKEIFVTQNQKIPYSYENAKIRLNTVKLETDNKRFSGSIIKQKKTRMQEEQKIYNTLKMVNLSSKNQPKQKIREREDRNKFKTSQQPVNKVIKEIQTDKHIIIPSLKTKQVKLNSKAQNQTIQQQKSFLKKANEAQQSEKLFVKQEQKHGSLNKKSNNKNVQPEIVTKVQPQKQNITLLITKKLKHDQANKITKTFQQSQNKIQVLEDSKIPNESMPIYAAKQINKDQRQQNIDSEEKQPQKQPTLKFHIDLGSIQRTVDKVVEERTKVKKDLVNRLSRNIIQPTDVQKDPNQSQK